MNRINYLMNDIWDEYGDDRVESFYLMKGGPSKVLLIIFGYLLFVKYFGPRLMKNRKAFDLRAFILIYNSILIGLNGMGFILGSLITEFLTKTWSCSPIDRSDTFRNKIFLLFGWLYFISKFADLLDTVFFILRKKTTHVTGLHVFHHFVMPLIAWFALKMHPSDYTGFLPVINTLIHALMYTYYALACCGNELKSLCARYKIYLTRLQMLQFVLVFFHSLNALIRSNCNWPIWLAVLECLHSLIFLFMFSIFYRNTYLKKVR